MLDTAPQSALSLMRPLPDEDLKHQLSLYVHYPFCVHKCPYCDFASDAQGQDEERDRLYIELLRKEWQLKLPLWEKTGRKLYSVYIGGGTPSLCAPKLWGRLFEDIAPYLAPDAEISLEANPGTVNLQSLQELHAVGFNRISLGVQSFNDAALKRLGRIHNSAEAKEACKAAYAAGFHNFNIDLMHGLPYQTSAEALDDLKQALALDCTHLSWYELTIEEGTYFGKHPPELPPEEVLLEIELQGWQYLEQENFEHYEVSGYNREGKYRCRHNLNYWLYGDYLGLGAAAHQKLSFIKHVPEERWNELWQHPQLLRALQSAGGAGAGAVGAGAGDGESERPDDAGLFTITRSANPEDFKTYQMQCLQACAALHYQSMPQNGSVLGAEGAQGRAYGDDFSEIPAQVGALHVLSPSDVPFEFMLNRLRLQRESISALEYLCHTGLALDSLSLQLHSLDAEGLISLQGDLTFAMTERGKLMLNDALCAFL